MGGGAKRKRKKTFLVMTLYDRTVLIITVKFIQLQDRTGGGAGKKGCLSQLHSVLSPPITAQHTSFRSMSGCHFGMISLVDVTS